MAPNWWRRLKAGRRTGVASTLAAVAVAGAVVTAIAASGATMSLWWLVTAGFFCIGFGVLAAFIGGHLTLLPDLMVDSLRKDGAYEAVFCSAESLREACLLTEPYYRSAYVSFERAEVWRSHNPRGFVELRNRDRQLCAAFGIIGLETSFMDQFLLGNVGDDQIDGSSVLSFEKTKASTRLYISGVVVRDPENCVGSKRASVMLWAMLEYLRRVFGFRRTRTLYALAVTSESERLLEGLSFSIVCPAVRRRDKRPLYSRQLEKGYWEELLHMVGDYSVMCKCRFD
jgi:hypothetical protein